MIIITIPERLDDGAIDALRERVEALRDDAAVRSVILTGEGEAFCRGLETPQVDRAGRRRPALISAIEGLGKPVIAAVNGDAIDAGLEIAVACTWRISVDRAGFALTGAGFGGASRLSRVIGKSRTHELILTGRRLEASEALAVGLVNQVLPDRAGLMSAAEDLAGQIARNAPLAVKYALDAVNAGSEMSLEAGLRLESTLFALCFATHDVREGARAFLEKRPPDFRGE
ncbi:MAG: enoyl-CoA hydratase/isomerase family protein [Acidobacteriota bacterium]|nr:MAG: enoyl-CoA hydratase/isomerase family protein [Acidobacteriota bacterium]